MEILFGLLGLEASPDSAIEAMGNRLYLQLFWLVSFGKAGRSERREETNTTYGDCRKELVIGGWNLNVREYFGDLEPGVLLLLEL